MNNLVLDIALLGIKSEEHAQYIFEDIQRLIREWDVPEMDIVVIEEERWREINKIDEEDLTIDFLLHKTSNHEQD